VCLEAGTNDIAHRFLRAASSTRLGKSRSPAICNTRTEGKRPAWLRFFYWYMAKLFRASQTDIVLTTRFLEMLKLLRQPAALLEAQTALRVWRGNRRGANRANPP
jgi:hypothetical protein